MKSICYAGNPHETRLISLDTNNDTDRKNYFFKKKEIADRKR